SAAAVPQPCSPCPASVRVASDIRDQRQIPSPLDRGRDLPLVPRAHARHAAREHLALFRDQAAERLLVLVVDLAYPRLAERARLGATTHATPPPRRRHRSVGPRASQSTSAQPAHPRAGRRGTAAAPRPASAGARTPAAIPPRR